MPALRSFLLTLALDATLGLIVGQPALRTVAISMFEEPEKQAKLSLEDSTRNHIVVTDGSGSFFNSRGMIQQLHDFGEYASICVAGNDVAETKKVLLSRQARYSGLLDILGFESEVSSASFAGANQWLAVNADAASLPQQISVAKAAGVERAFILVSEGPLDATDGIATALQESGMAYTLMRTGPLISASVDGGLSVSEFDLPVCEEVPKEEVFRFVAEALTLPSAHGRVFSLCPSPVTSRLKQMRLAGYGRRDEVDALLLGQIAEPAETQVEEQTEAEKELVMRSAAEVEAEREEELKALLAKARQRGVDAQAKLVTIKAEKAEFRKEQEEYYKAPGGTKEDAPGGTKEDA